MLNKYDHLKWISENDDGQSDAMNKGFKMSTGDIIVYLNSDDFFHPNTFNLVTNNFDRNIDIILGNVEVRDYKNETFISKPSKDFKEILEHWRALFPINPIQYFYKRKIQDGVLFNKNNHLAMDHEFIIEIFDRKRIKYIDKTFGVYRHTKFSKTAIATAAPELYWTPDNFSYIDKHLINFPKKYVLDFKIRQYSFFHETIQKYKKWKLKLIQKECVNIIAQNIINFQDWILNRKSFILYGAGTTARIIYPLIKDKVSKVIDCNKRIQNTYLGTHIIESIENIEKDKPDSVLISIINSKESIEQLFSAYKNIQLFFLSDITQIPHCDITSNDSYEFYSRFIHKTY